MQNSCWHSECYIDRCIIENPIEISMDKNKGSLEIKNETWKYEKVWDIEKVELHMDTGKGKDETWSISKFNCSIFRRRWNKLLTWRNFMMLNAKDEEEIKIRIMAYYILKWVIWKLKEKDEGFFEKVYEWNLDEMKRFSVTFEAFDRAFRLLIT